MFEWMTTERGFLAVELNTVNLQWGCSACTVMVIWPFEHMVRGWAVTAEKSMVEGSTISRKRFANDICSYDHHKL